MLTVQLAISLFLTVQGPDSGASGLRGWLAWLTVPGRLGEETMAGWLSQHAWEGVCVPHVNVCTGLAYGLTKVWLWMGV